MKSYLLTFASGVIVGIICLLLFSEIGTDNAYKPATTFVSPETIISYTKQMEAHFKTKIDSLKAKNTALQQKVTTTKYALLLSKQKYNGLEQEIRELTVTGENMTDTAEIVNNCDSLYATVDKLLTENTLKDSLYENLAVDLEYQLIGKDSIIQFQQQQYDTLKVSFDKTLLQQQELINSNQHQAKQLKKQQRRKKWMSALLFIWAGFTTYQAIK